MCFQNIDGRPTPLSVGQVKRRELQNKLTIDTLNGLNYLNRTKQLIDELKNKQ